MGSLQTAAFFIAIRLRLVSGGITRVIKHARLIHLARGYAS